MKIPLAFRNHPASSSPPVSRTRAAGRNLLVLLLAATTSFTSYAQSNLCAATPSGLVAWWPGNDSPAELIHGNNGTLSGGAVYTNAIVGAGFSLDGLDDRVVVADAPVLNFGSNQDLSIECWIKAYPNSNPSNVRAIVDKRNAAENYRGYTLFLWDGFLAFQLSEISKGVNYFSSGADLRDGVFHHVAVTVDRDSTSGGRLYVDGQIIYTFDPTGVMGDLSNSDVLRIGQHATPGGSSSFPGVIDDIAIYNRALSTAEVQSVYQAGSAGKCAAVAPAPVLLNVDFGAGLAGTSKTGFAAIGMTTNDFWNFYTRDDGAGGWRTFGVLPNLKSADGTITTVGLTVANAPGAWGNGSSDPMYVDYIYPFDGGNVTVTVTNLPAGQYDVLAYANDGNYEVSAGGVSQGVKTTLEPTPANPPIWTHGVQYARFTNVNVALGQPLVLAVRPGIYGWAVISGLQIVSSATTNGVPTTNCTAAPSGLASWWRGEGNPNDAVGTNSGHLLGGATYVAGEVGQGFGFNGTNSYVNIPSSEALKPAGPFTFEAWIRYSGNPGAVSSYCIAAKGPDAEAAMDWALTVSANSRLRPHISLNGGWDYFDCNTTLSAGTWYHVVMVYDGAHLQGYVNGALDGSANISGSVHTSDAPLRIGAYAPVNGTGSKAFFTGSIDEVSFYNRNLSAGELLAIYQAGSAGKCPPTNPPPVSCVNPPSGLVSWWRGEGNAADESGVNNGTLLNGTTFAGGEVGQAFVFNDATADVRIPASPSINVGIGAGFTIEAWIAPTTLAPQPVFEWNSGTGYDDIGAHLWISASPSGAGAAGNLFANLRDTAGGSHFISSAAGVVVTNRFQHVALTYDKTSGAAVLYCNGLAVADQNMGALTLFTTYDLHLGRRAGGYFSEAYYRGMIDEASLYSRALSAAEIQSIYNAGSAGKCLSSPPFNPGDGLVAHYPFNGDGSDVSGNGNHGVPSNAVLAADRFGASNAAFSFNGQNAAVTVADNPALRSLASNYTLNAWVRFGSNPQIDAAILMKSAGAGDQRKWIFWRHVQAPPYGIGLLLNRAPGQFQWNHNSPFAIGQWYMVTFSASANNCLIAVDGQVVSAQSGNLVLPDTIGSALSIGGAEPAGNQWFNGLLDDIRIYNRTFTSNDIAQLYQLESVQSPTPSVVLVPRIDSFSPVTATSGSSVTISGTNFSPVASSNIVYFGAVRANITAASSNSLTVTVPGGATYAPLTVTVNGLTAAARTAFTPTFSGDAALSTASFSPRVNVGTGDGPTGTAIADLDGDGKPDIAVTDDYGHTLSIYRTISVAGTLDATSFAPRVVLPASAADYSPYMLATGDVDGDGKLDLITTDVGGNTVSVYRNQSAAGSLNSNSFAPFVSFAVGTGPRAVALVDLDADGRPEIVTANYDASTVSVLRNAGVAGQISSNSFSSRFDLPTGAGAHGLVVTDLDGDGRPDLATANGIGASLSLFRNIGSGPVTSNSFAAPVTLSGPTFAHFVRAADLDADGRSELLLTSYLGQTLTVYRNQADSGVLDTNSFAAGITLALAGRGHTISLGDLNGDTKVDIAVDTEIGDSIALFQNQSVPGGFTNDSLAARVDLVAGWNAWGSSVGDLDGDGRPDIIFANAYDDTISLYRNLTTLSNQPQVSCVNPPLGLVSWWQAESGGSDSIGNNPATLLNDVVFVPGKVGQALDFNGTTSSGVIPASPTLHVGAGAGFTIETWIKPAAVDLERPIVEWNSVTGGNPYPYGVHLWISVPVGFGAGPGCLYANLTDTAGNFHPLTSAGGLITAGNYQHVALTYDKASGQAMLYLDGHVVASQNLGSFTPQTSYNLYLGNRPGGSAATLNWSGQMDEVTLYNRALTSNEIATVFLAGSAGKCATNPPLCTPPSSGLVSWWRAENNGGDIISGNTGDLLDGTGFGPGQVGQAFQFDGAHDSIRVAARAATDVGTQAGFTIEAWINPIRTSIGQIAEWNNGASGTGVHLWHSVDTFVAGDGVANLYANLVDTSGISHALWSPAGLVATNAYNHVALTYDKTTGLAELFHNGVSVSSTNLGSFTPQTSYDLYFGKRASGPFSEPINHFQGTMDEVSLYSRALAQTEIQAIYDAGSAGKCPPTAVAPNISHQPQSATVAAGANVQLDVTATGVPAPTYQWFFAADSLAGQTNATLFLNNVQPSQAGDYFVIVANPSGSVTSSVATLTVQTFPPTITSQPQDRSVYAGKTVAFTVQAAGTAPLHYQWSQDGTALPNTTSTLTLLNVQSNHAGLYQVVVSNDYGSATSRLAQLIVTPPPPCAPAPGGVIAWWPGQSNLWDVVGGFDAQFIQSVPSANLLYTTGKVGAAISFNYLPTIVAVTAGALNLNTNNGLTIEGWIRPDGSGPRPIAEWNDGKTVGASLLLSLAGPGAIEATLTDSNVPVRTVTFRSPNFTITNLLWQHVALTYDKSAGVATILVNGNPVIQTNIGTMTPNTSGNVYLGYRPAGIYVGTRFRGALDEITLYNRALSAAELQSIIAADEIGKCPPPPPACVKPPADISAWWRGESNTVDSVAGNDAIRMPTNFPVTQFYQAGQLGTAFSLLNPRFFAVPRSEGLDVGTGSGLTVEAWIYPGQLSPMPIVEWTDTNSYGVNLWMSYSRGPTVLEANLIDNGGGFHLIRSPVGTIRGYSWQHVAVTYDKTTGVAALYSDGNLVTTTNLGFFTPRTHTELLIGFHPRNTVSGPDGTPPTIDYRFNGAIDELAIYRRALSAAEIRNVARQRPGKCLELPPVISRHPQEQVALEGGTARFDVGVGGTAPFQYQWLFVGEAIAAGTNSFLALTGIEPADASPYSVLVSNAFGSVTSRVAALTVLPANQCLPTPFGAVAFWRGQSNTLDELGSHPAQWGTNTLPAYTTVQTGGGKVATAFRFTGQNHLLVPTNSNLDVGAGGGFTIEGWIKPDSLSSAQPVWDWNDGLGNIGVGLLLGRTGPGMLEVTLTDTNVTSTQLRVVTLTTPNFTLGSITNQVSAWSHVALTFDKATGKLNLFVNGKLVGEQTIGLVPGGVTSGAANKLFSPVTTGNLHFGWRRSGVFQGSRFRGAMDEMSVYYRALTPLELQAIYIVGANGKCTPAPTCQPLASSIVSWWRGESNVLDSVDGNHGSNNPAPLYTNGIVGSGFRITSGRYIQIPAKPELHVGAGAGFTFETWFRRDTQTTYTIAAWNSGSLTQGVSFGSSPTRGPDYLEANLVDTLGNSHVLSFYTYVPGISGGLIPVGKWNHLALTYEKLSGKAILFLNGSPVVATNVGSFTPRTLGNLYLGYRPPGNYPGSGTVLTGALDETTLYNRALSSGEITANYRNVANRCLMAPTIVSHPGNVRVNPGSNVTFQVIAEGNPLLRYQWGVDRSPVAGNSPLPGQTNSLLLLTNVQTKDAGRYWVQVTNAFGTAVSSNINLIVNSRPNAFNQSITTAEETPRSFTLLASDANQDPLIFTVLTQPTNGTLSHTSSNWVYTPALNYNGPDSFTFKVSDGLLESAPATVSITVTPVNDPPTTASQIVATDEDTPLPITLAAADVDGDALTFNITPPAHGTLSGTAPDLIYTPHANFFGDDLFMFTVRDGSNAVSELAVVSITVHPVNDVPIARIVVAPLDELPGVTNLVALAPACCEATLRLDASESSDVENDALTYTWLEGTNILSTAITATNRFNAGTHEITLLVSDGTNITPATVIVEIITPAEAIAFLQTLVEEGITETRDRMPLLNWLNGASEAMERCQVEQGLRFLESFQQRIRDRIASKDAELAAALIETSTAIMEAAPDCDPSERLGRPQKTKHEDRGRPDSPSTDSARSPRTR